MDAAELIRRMKAQRRAWHELDDPPRRALQLERPAEMAVMKWRGSGLTTERVPELLRECVVDWRGFTEADLLGASIGGDTEQPFDREVFSIYIEDHAEELSGAAMKVFDLIKGHQEAREVAGKNSKAS